MSIRSLSGLLALSVLSAACSSTSASVEVAPELSAFDVATQQGEAYCMVIMRKGAAADHIDLNELGEITQVHLDFLEGDVHRQTKVAHLKGARRNGQG